LGITALGWYSVIIALFGEAAASALQAIVAGVGPVYLFEIL
jgi:hypothetical protein